MKKLFIIICALFVGIANADNVITSKEYVDTQGATLQPQVQAKNTNTVLTYPAAGTDTPGEKAIYDSSAAYGEQTDALVTAGQFNNALQVALDTEFVCVSRNEQGCLLYEITAQKNLFRGPYVGGINQNRPVVTDFNTILASPYTSNSSWRGPVFVATVEPGSKYKLTSTTNARYARFGFYESESAANNPDNIIQWTYGGNHASLTVPDGATYFILSLSSLADEEITWSDVRLTKVSNNYMPEPAANNN